MDEFYRRVQVGGGGWRYILGSWRWVDIFYRWVRVVGSE